MNSFSQWYELNSEFRAFIQAKIDSGRLSKTALQRIAGLPPWNGEPSEADESDLIELARKLLLEADRS